MSETLKWRSFLSAIVVVSAGSLLHFAWGWSGRSTLVAVFAATNESTWEHLKLAFWPALALAPIQRMIYGSEPGWLPATAIRCVVPSFVIVALFYGYTAVTGTHHLAADLAIFAVAIFAGEVLGHAVLRHEFGAASRMGASGVLVLATLLFSTLTFRPPDCFLFHEPSPDRSGDEETTTGPRRPPLTIGQSIRRVASRRGPAGREAQAHGRTVTATPGPAWGAAAAPLRAGVRRRAGRRRGPAARAPAARSGGPHRSARPAA